MPTKREEEEIQDAGSSASRADRGAERKDESPPAAGWYPDPRSPSKEWFWDGSEWTSQSRTVSGESEGHEAKGSPLGGTRTDIDAAASRMNWKLGSRREIKKLPSHLHDGEVVADMAAGTYGGGTGLFVLTDQRLFFLRDGWTGATHEDFPLERITTVGFTSRFGTGAVAIHASGNTAEITSVISADGKRIAATARKVAGPNHVASAESSDSSADPMDQLKKLGELKDLGILTLKEFEEKKKILLDRL